MKVRKWSKRGIQGVLLWYLFAALLPFPHEKLRMSPQNIRYLDEKGQFLRRSLGDGGMDTDWIPLSACGEWAGPALIAVEDQRFYQHGGVDPFAVLRAAGQNLLHLRVVSGASTISTQVIRLIEPRKRNLVTKLIEAFRATQLEMRYDKDFILEQYMNRAPFGGNRQGLATASRRYFGKEPANLSSGEAALLMGLPQSPSRFRPDRFPERAEKRRQTVLRRMVEERVLKELPLVDYGPRWVEPPLKAFHFTEWVRRRHAWQGGELRTTLDLGLQQTCEAVLEAWRQKPAYAETDGVGVVLMDAKTGDIRAWVGNWDGANPEHGQVDTVTRRRAPGSTLKPFAYAVAMEQGWLTPETRLEDSPRVYRDYRPENMHEQWSGDVSAKDALVQSLNLPALQVVEKAGVQEFLAVLRASGMRLRNQKVSDIGLGSVLGGGMEVSLLEVVQGYSVFARNGRGVKVKGVVGEPNEGNTVFCEGVAYWINRMLSGSERDEVLYGHWGDVAQSNLAFKTGTSHGMRDAWAIGWNDQWVLGIWVGRMDGGAVSGLSGSTHAAPLLGELVRELLHKESREWPVAPETIQTWRGRQVVAGVTDPEEGGGWEIQRRIVQPAPQEVIQTVEGGAVWMSLRAMAGSTEEVHWFVNGVWQGQCQVKQPLPLHLDKGVYEIRAVFQDGTADSRDLRIL